LHLPAFGKDKQSLRLVRSEEIDTSINFFFADSRRKTSVYFSCPGLHYASHKAQPVSAVRTQAVVFSLHYDPTWDCSYPQVP